MSERNIAVERSELIAHRGGKRGGIREVGPRYDKDEVDRNLGGRKVHFRREILLERKMSDVADHADNLTHLGFLIGYSPAGLDAFADHVLTWEKFLREALIHYHHWE